MPFVSKNEIDKFSFQDAEVTEFSLGIDTLQIVVEALRVLPNNSQNTNYTESFAGTAKILITGVKILRVVREGFKYFDANDNLIDEVLEKEIPGNEWKDLFKEFNNSYLADVSESGIGYKLVFETADEFGAAGDSYILFVEGNDVTVSWDKYMNRVEH